MLSNFRETIDVLYPEDPEVGGLVRLERELGLALSVETPNRSTCGRGAYRLRQRNPGSRPDHLACLLRPTRRYDLEEAGEAGSVAFIVSEPRFTYIV
jgi:hypothetical protein